MSLLQPYNPPQGHRRRWDLPKPWEWKVQDSFLIRYRRSSLLRGPDYGFGTSPVGDPNRVPIDLNTPPDQIFQILEIAYWELFHQNGSDIYTSARCFVQGQHVWILLDRNLHCLAWRTWMEVFLTV